MANPNFPPNLAISASTRGQTSLKAFDVEAQNEAIRTYGIAGRVWEAAYTMQKYLLNVPQLEFDPLFLPPEDQERDLKILELGSGTGIIVALLAQVLAGRQDIVIASDLPEVCSLLEKNLAEYLANQSHSRPLQPRVEVCPLAWGNSDHVEQLLERLRAFSKDVAYFITHIICSDLVYFPELLGPLLRSLIQLTSPPFGDPEHPTKVIISYKIRSLPKETPFWSAFGLWFDFVPVLCKQKDTQVSSDGNSGVSDVNEGWRVYGTLSEDDSDTYIFVGRRRTESYSWDVPGSDAELLAGVGAYGTQNPKSDSTFETILLMELGESF
ncbi:hypothetical protein K474DRAFT_1684499 [Panus rudis PR-1116 ss-1]|nr:hypothetical protein K474DRAFT_1684499 [Panus rudis PR-1116 ss-1]